ncbi:MAG: UDP-N-acetylglucosamine 2-epimerase (non-hydrolyzing) [Deltaproteobacteria bacterium]|nr:UDP-N-acetylglucosamine 2-epimerase (non-hydrolyzing) [Deltaproteobacteria bacterium]
MAPLVRACAERGLPFFLLHSGQHYSPSMDRVFFEDLELPQPAHQLETGGLPYRLQVGAMIRDIRGILAAEKATVALVQGDTNTVLAGALAAAKLGVAIAHHEAGLRSHDLTMPEERNRILTDHLADFLFAPTEAAQRNLLDEGLPPERILVTGNTIVDAVRQNRALAERRDDLLERLGLQAGCYFLATAHRQENVDSPARLRGILEGLSRLAAAFPAAGVVFSLHPRTRARLDQIDGTWLQGVRFIEPVGFLDFLLLESRARLLVTDSGGVQEEASILRVPCVTVRDNTERPETLEAGINVLAGTDPERIVQAALSLLGRPLAWPDLYGDGHAAERIVEALARHG